MKEFAVIVYVVEDDFHGTEIVLTLVAADKADAKFQVLRAVTWADEILDVIELPEF